MLKFSLTERTNFRIIGSCVYILELSVIISFLFYFVSVAAFTLVSNHFLCVGGLGYLIDRDFNGEKAKSDLPQWQRREITNIIIFFIRTKIIFQFKILPIICLVAIMIKLLISLLLI